MAGGAVEFDVPVETAYDFLVDPTQRPLWQSSLLGVELFPGWTPGEPVVAGLQWTDVTWPGLRPRMELTRADRPNSWTERGRWHGVTAGLTLTFMPTAFGCRVSAEFEVRTPGVLGPVGSLLTVLAVRAVLADLRRAAGILGRAES